MPLYGARWMLVRIDDRSVDRVDVQRPEGAFGVNVCALDEKYRRSAYPMPNSSQLVLPTSVAPEAVSRCTAVASKGDWKSDGMA